MVTLNIYIKFEKNEIKKTMNKLPVYVRITKERKSKYIRLPYNLFTRDINKNGMVVNSIARQALERDLQYYNDKLIALGVSSLAMSIEQIYDKLTRVEAKDTSFQLDYFEWMESYINSIENQSTARIYKNAERTMREFYHGTIDINDMDRTFFQHYIDWMYEKGQGRRSVEIMISNHRAVFNAAINKFNDDDIGLVNIQRYPFKNLVIKKADSPTKRALSPFAMNYMLKLDTSEMDSSLQLAYEAFITSFYLCGCNSADMYELGAPKNGYVEYYRKKTRARNAEGSHIIIKVQPELDAIIEKQNPLWKGKFAFVYNRLYADAGIFNTVINTKLKIIAKYAMKKYAKEHKITEQEAGELLGYGDLTFYHARHTWASIAVNNCNVPIDVVDKCLCHTVNSVAERSYVTRTFDFVDVANRKVLDFVLNSQDTYVEKEKKRKKAV
jgi:integrase